MRRGTLYVTIYTCGRLLRREGWGGPAELDSKRGRKRRPNREGDFRRDPDMGWRLTIAAVVAVGMACPMGTQAAGGSTHRRTDGGGTQAATASLESAATIFDRARKLGFPAAGQAAAYVLKAEFTTRGSSGVVETGTYRDTWENESHWRREADLGKSRFARSRNGRKLYRLADGPDAALLQYVLTAMEPIPATDAEFVESDWRVTRDTVDGAPATRVASGRENKDGTPDPKEFLGFWFDDAGQLVKTYENGLETRRSDFFEYSGVKVARRVEVSTKGEVGMRIVVTALGPAGKVDSHLFTIKGHGWSREYTTEVR